MLFPLRFDPARWNGPRAQQHSDRSDAFQQVVGDLLREQFGWRASVSPTEGRDGSIDAFVDEVPGSPLALVGMGAPQIVECKDHDDSRGNFLKNVVAGWSRVAQKLRGHAESGWGGHFRPWQRARSYVYCLSGVLGSQQDRDNLNRTIAQFFEELPASQRPPLEGIRVLDWSDLRSLFNKFPRVSDRWLGTGLPLLQSHAEYCASLTSFRRHLMQGSLPFVEPTEDQAQPRSILTRLEALAGTGGLILKGVGGVGKTRTSLEVAHLADAGGWRVLHSLPGEPGVTAEDLAATVLSEGTPTLLVFDYLDQMPRLDLGSLRKRLMPEAIGQGVRLAFLANLRPSSLRRTNAERDALFPEEILLQPSAQQRVQITDTAIDRIAPLAIAQLGRERVRELCGERPIIAILIAEELQRRAAAGTLGSVGGFRRGDLLSWLRRRLVEDGLTIESSSFLPSEPDAALVAAAAMLAAAPMGEDDLVAVGRVAIGAAGGSPDSAGRVLGGLLTLGWIEPRDTELATAHDVVADEVLAQVLWDRASGVLRDSALGSCLAAALHRVRVLGRYATALTRLLGPEDVETAAEALLRQKAGAWLRSHGTRLGDMLLSAEASESAYALGGVVSAPAWADACVAAWGDIVTPWLARYGTQPEARHLLYRGLRRLPSPAPPQLVLAGLNWLQHHLTSDDASYVVAPLIARTDLAEHAPRAITLAMGWLEKFPLAPEARFVFNPLLARTDLAGHAPRAITLAMGWLEKFPLAPEAQFVFNPLLARTDLAGHAPRAITLAMGWLEKFPLAPEAPFVFAPLLARTDLAGHAPRAITLAMGWLEKFPLAPEAQFVFAPLLARTDLAEHAPRAITLAMGWLEKFPLAPEARFVFNPLLARTDLAGHAPRAITLAMGWLEKFPLAPEAQFVFNPLLARTDLAGHAPRAITLAMGWLEKFPLAPEAQFVFAPLLARTDLAGHAPRAITLAMGWLEANRQTRATEFVLKRLFGRGELDAKQRSQCLSIAVPHLEALGSAPEASHLLKGCLRDRALNGESARLVVQLGIVWLKANPREVGADFVFNRLLTRPRLSQAEWTDVSEIALAWLRMYTSEVNRDLSLASLLTRSELLAEPDLTFILEEARQWLGSPPKGARPPVKLLKQLRYFQRVHDPVGEMFPSAILERWKDIAC